MKLRTKWIGVFSIVIATIWFPLGMCQALGSEPTPLVLLGDKDYPPMAYLEEGIAKGMDVDLARALASPMKREIRIELLDWNLAQEKVLKGEADGLLGMSISDERRKLFDFASPAFTREFGLLVRNGDMTIRHTSDLQAKRVGVTPGGFPRRFLEAQTGVNLILINNYQDGFDRLTTGTIDAMAVDLWVATYLMEKDGIRGVTIAGKPFATTQAAIAVKKGNPALVDEINRAIKALKADGKISAIQEYWRPQEMLFVSRERVRGIVTLAVGVLLVILFGAMGIWIFTLKKQMRTRKEVEAALRKGEERFQLAVRGSTDGLWDRNILTDEVFYADRYRELLGYSADEFPGAFASFESRLHPDDKDRVLNMLAAHLERRQPYDAEYRLQTRSGEYHWFRGRGQAIWDEQGRAIRMAGSITDITDRKQGEQLLRESEQRLRTLTDASFEGIGVCEDGILVDANDQLVKMLGYTRSEMIGKPVIEFVAPESRDFVRRKTESAQAEPYEHAAIRKDGTTFPVEVCGRTLASSPRHVRVTAVRDMTARKQAEERINLLQMITMDVTATTDLPSALEVVLRRVCERTGWALGQAWVPRQDGTSLDCCPAWFATAAGLDHFRALMKDFSFPPGGGLPGRVWASRQPVWIRDVTLDTNFPRAEFARKAGLKAGLGVPILSGEEVIAVLEFFLRETRDEDERLVKVISAVAAQIGLVIERKRAEEALRKSEEKFSKVFVSAPAAMAVTRPRDARILDVNREFTKMLGYSRDEVIGRTTLEVGLLVDPNDREVLLQLVSTSGEVKDFELRLRAKNGSVVIGRYSAQMTELGGEPLALSAFVDMTERKEAEEEVRASREELRALAGRLQAVREEERTRIAREIHDVLAQELTRLKIDLGWLGKRLSVSAKEVDRQALSEKVIALSGLTDATISTVQKIAAELRPVVLDSLGLSAAIEWQAEEFQARTGIPCEAIVTDEDFQLPRESATGIFRIVQESLTNVIRHARATRVEIILESDERRLRLLVQDNGIGFDETEMKDPHSMGLLGMRERAVLLGGQFEISGAPGKGTRVSVTMPFGGRNVTIGE